MVSYVAKQSQHFLNANPTPTLNSKICCSPIWKHKAADLVDSNTAISKDACLSQFIGISNKRVQHFLKDVRTPLKVEFLPLLSIGTKFWMNIPQNTIE